MAINPLVISTFEGLFTRSEPAKVPPGRLVAAHNIRYREDTITPRPGLSMAITVPFSFTGPHILTTCPLIPGILGEPYSVQLVATGGTPEYTWTAEGLPTGLSLTTGGLLSGTPEEEGTTSFTITVTDAAGAIVTKQCSLVIAEEPGVFTARIPLEMLGSDIFGTFEQEDLYTSTGLTIDPDDYPNVEASWWEVTLRQANGAVGDCKFSLVDEFDVEYAFVDGSMSVPGTGSPYTRVRVAFTLSASIRTYMVKVAASEDGLDADISKSTILLDQVLAPATKIQIPMMYLDASDGGGDDPGENDIDLWCAARNGGCEGDVYGSDNYSTTDCLNHPYPMSIFLKEESKYSVIDHWELDVVASLAYFGSPGTGHVALFNRTTDTMVTGTEQAFTSTTAWEHTSISFANDAANFADGDEFEVRFRCTSGAVMTIHRTDLYVKLTDVTKALIYNRVGGSNGLVVTVASRVLYEADAYAAGTLFYHEVVGYRNLVGSSTVSLVDAVSADVGFPSVTKFAGAQVVGAGSLWDNAAGILGDADGDVARLRMTSNGTLGGVPNATSLPGDVPHPYITLSNFGFDGTVPPAATLRGLVVGSIVSAERIVFTDGSFIACTGFTTSGNIVSKARLSFGGVDTSDSGLVVANSTVLSGNCAGHLLVQGTKSYNFSVSGLVESDFNNSNFEVKVGMDLTSWSDFNMGEILFDGVSVTVQYGETLAAVIVSSTTKSRQRTSAITLTDGNRYIWQKVDTAATVLQNFILAEVNIV